MVVFNPVESLPLECFLLDVCQHSLHASIVSLWFLENYLVDLREQLSTREGAPRFDRCARLLQEVQLAVWGDLIKPTPLRRLSLEYSAVDEEGGTGSEEQSRSVVDTLPGIEATLVGFGCAMAAFASPRAAQAMRPLVLMEARKRDRLRFSASTGNRRFRPLRTLDAGHPAHPNMKTSAATAASNAPSNTSPVSIPMTSSFPSIEDLSHGRAFSLRDAIARTARQVRRATVDPTGSSSTSPLALNSAVGGVMPPLYYHPEMQFVMGLIDVAQRLCHVNKEGRQQALLAELSLLNHNLPAALCIPLWCHGSDQHPSDAQCRAFQSTAHVQPHHRLLRIPVSEAVILNSAERAPYVVYVEVVRGMDDAEFSALLQQEQKPSGLPPSLAPSQRTFPLPAADQTSTPSKSKSRSTPPAPTGPGPVVPASPLPTGDLLEQPVDGTGFAERMRTAAIMLAQLTRQATAPGCPAARLADIDAIKTKLIAEMEALERCRLLDALHGEGAASTAEYNLDSARPAKDDPSAAVFREAFEEKRARIRASSPYGRLPGWDLHAVIVKAGADMRQEQLACQIIEEMHDIWSMAGLPIWVCPFRILVAAAQGGLVETVRNALSIHSIRKAAYAARPPNPATDPQAPFSLRDHYLKTFGSPDSDAFINARDAFMKSLAGYSLVTYLLALKDRHNGNILIDAHGHMVHIDFGFMLTNCPGGYYGFESAPFKLSAEYIDLLGGLQSESFAAFKELIFQGFMALRKHADRIVLLLDIAQKDSKLPCFGSSGPNAIAQLRQRFQLGLTEAQVKLFVERMITGSAYNVYTRLYDSFQYYSNGIL